MKDRWEVIFHDDFVPEFRELSESTQNVLVALNNPSREGPAVGTANRRHAKGLASRQHEGIALRC
jgi:hypothetical protein